MYFQPKLMPPPTKVLLVLPYEPAAFMRADEDILRRHFEVSVIIHNRGKARLFLGVLRHMLFDRPDVLLMWFIVPSYALALTLMAKIVRVKVAFVTGGYDVVSMPSIGFGAMRFPLFRRMLKPTLRLADLTLPFSESAAEQVRKYARPRRMQVIYPGIDTDFFSPATSVERAPLAVSVSPVTESSIVQKGLRTFVEAAQYTPEVKFVLVGRSPDGAIEQLREIASPNVEFIDRFIPSEELRDLYRRAWCYVQASVHEGFGIAVAEAMSCGAVPVVTRRFSLPEVAGDLGEYIPLGEPQALAAAVMRTKDESAEKREALHLRVVENFPLARRDAELTKVLMGLARRGISSEADSVARPEQAASRER